MQVGNLEGAAGGGGGGAVGSRGWLLEAPLPLPLPLLLLIRDKSVTMVSIALPLFPPPFSMSCRGVVLLFAEIALLLLWLKLSSSRLLLSREPLLVDLLTPLL